MDSCLDIYLFHLDDDLDTSNYYQDYLSTRKIESNAVAFCVCLSNDISNASLIEKYFTDISYFPSTIETDSQSYSFFIKSVLGGCKSFVVHDPLNGETCSKQNSYSFDLIYSSIGDLKSKNILGSRFKNSLRNFSYVIDGMDSPYWRGNFRLIYRYLSALHFAVLPFSEGPHYEVNQLANINIVKAAKKISTLQLPLETLENIGDLSSIQIELSTFFKKLRVLTNGFEDAMDHNEFPMFYLWMFFIFELIAEEYKEIRKVDISAIYLVRMVEVTGQSILLKGNHISHKGYGRFRANDDQKNLMGAGSYLELMRRFDIVNEEDAGILSSVVSARNNLSTAHGFSSLDRKDYPIYFDKVMRIVKSLLRSNVENGIIEGFDSLVAEKRSAKVIDSFLEKFFDQVELKR